MGLNDSQYDNLKEMLELVDERQAFSVLLQLGSDENTGARIMELITEELKKVSSEQIASAVFRSLNALDAEYLWDNSGKTRHGYVEPSELAYEMMEDALRPYVDEMHKFRSLHMEAEENAVCEGIISGLRRYDEDATNDISDWEPDFCLLFTENLIYDYSQHHGEEETERMRELVGEAFELLDSDEDESQ